MALDRRGLAYDQAAVLSFEVHSAWVAELIRAKHRIPPPRYEPVSWHQLYDADKELFLLASQSVKGGIRPGTDGVKPLDAIFKKLMEDNRVTFFLMPLGQGGGRVVEGSPQDAAERPLKKARHESGHGRGAATPSHDKGSGKSKAKGKSSKGKGGSKSGGKQRTLPQSGSFYTQTKSGKPICPDFNGPSGCNAGTRNGSGLMACPKGLHLCSAPRCTARHSHGYAAHSSASHE